MQRWQAIGTVIRWPNLLFIALTQALSWFCLVKPVLPVEVAIPFHQSILILATVLIAAAGYMINDYFDWQIDSINKPERVVIGKLLSRRVIMLCHITLNALAVCMVYFAFRNYGSTRLLLWQVSSIVLLWFYSTTYKRRLLIGNIVVACMTTLTVALPALFEPQWSLLPIALKGRWIAYGVFAFLVTLIREIVKDIEDIKGDSSQGCLTLPLVWGVNKARYLVDGLWGLMIIGLALMLYWFQTSNVLEYTAYALLLVPIPYLIARLHRAKTTVDFAQVSREIKIYTLLGILSMLL
jgi:4-hydroxybenzoate polyprenyltransferase